MARAGRPRAEINQKTFESLCAIQCTLEEIAGVLDVSEDTVERWCARTYSRICPAAHHLCTLVNDVRLEKERFVN